MNKDILKKKISIYCFLFMLIISNNSAQIFKSDVSKTKPLNDTSRPSSLKSSGRLHGPKSKVKSLPSAFDEHLVQSSPKTVPRLPICFPSYSPPG